MKLAEKWLSENGYYPESKRDCSDELKYVINTSSEESMSVNLQAEVAKLRKRCGELKADARELPMELFDGLEVYKSMPREILRRTSADNVSDVLDAVVKLIRARKAQTEGA